MKIAKKSVLAVLICLLLVSLSAFAVIQISAVASTDGVLEGNTAQYTFENDAKNPWGYDRANNTWTRYGVDTSNQETGTLKLNVTQDGNIALDYFIDSRYDGGLKISVSGSSERVVLAETYDATDGFISLEPIAVKAQDVVTISYRSTWSTSTENCAKIKGLLLPDNKVSVTVEAGENGELSLNGATQNSFVDQEVLFGGVLNVEAKPDQGYVFAYWADEAGNAITYNPVLDITHMQDGKYKALFHQIGSVSVSMSKIDGKDTWKEVDNGGEKHYEADMDVITSGLMGTLAYDFTGGGYFSFDYRESVNTDEYIYVYLDGVQILSDYSYNRNYTTVDKLPWVHKFYALPSDGFHRLEFVYADAGSQADPNSGHLDVVHVKDIKAPMREEELNLVDYEIQFNQNLGEVYLIAAESAPNIQDFKQTGQQLVPGKQTKVAVGLTVFFGIFPNKNYTSTIDPSQTTDTVFVGTYLKDNTELSRNGLGASADYAFYVKTEFTNDGITAGGKQSADRYLEIKMQEKAVAPETVSVNYKVNGVDHEKEEIENGHTYSVPYGSKNQFTVAISDYSKVEEQLKITKNGEKVSYESVNDYFGFTLNDLDCDTTISIQIEYGDYYASDPFIIQVNLTLDDWEDIQKYLNPLGNVTIENDEAMPWKFSSTYSNDEMLAYIAGNSGYGNGEDNSSLKFTVTGSGTLTFDFYLEGYSGYDMAGYEFNKTLGNPTMNKFTSGKTMALAQGAYKNKYVESKIVDNSVVTSLSATLGSGWFHAEIPVSTSSVGSPVDDGTQVVIYVAYGKWMDSSSYTNDVMAIRNIMYLQGKSTITFNIVDGNSEQADGNGTIEAKIANKDVLSGSEADMGDKLVLTAKPASKYSFYAWRDAETKEIISYDKNITITVVGDIKVEAVIADTGTYAARVGDKFYSTLEDAFEAATTDKTVIVVDNISVNTETTIPKGIKLVIPFNGEGEYYAEGTAKTATNRVSWGTADLESTYLFRKVTFNGNLIIAGELYVGGVLHYPDQSAQAHTSGAYAELVVNGQVTVENEALMDVCGRVTGTGMITVKAGGKIIQPFLILDFAGGTNTSGLYGQDQTPFNRYAVINVQCEQGLKIEYKGELWGHVSLYAIGGVNALDAPIISYSDGLEESPRGFITLTDGGSVTAIYHDTKKVTMPDDKAAASNNTIDIGYTEMIFESSKEEGGAIANSLTMTYSIVTISTANVVGFSVPYNYQIVLKSGKYKLEGNFKLMPGASLTVEENATLTVRSGQNLIVYDGLVQSKMSGKSYPTAEDLTAAKYSTNGNLIVNGTLVVESGTDEVPSMLLGLIQTTNTKGTAQIIIGNNVTLSAKIVDGGLTSYDCNYSEYVSSARVWDKVNGILAELVEGHNYKSVYLVGDQSYQLPAVKVMYDNFNEYKSNTKANHIEHGTPGSHYVEGYTLAVEGLKGAWMIEHSEHTYDWTPHDKDSKPSESNRVVQLDRQCTELGCDHKEHKNLLYVPESLGEVLYKGSAYTEAELKAALFDKLFGEDFVDGFNAELVIVGDAINSGTHNVTINLTNGYWKDGESYVAGKEFSWNIAKYTLTEANIEITQSEEEIIYNGSKWQPAYKVTWNGTGEIASEAQWGENIHAGVKAGSLTITGNGNFDGTVTVNFTIKPKPITVTIKPQTTTYTGEAQTFSHTDGEVNDLSYYSYDDGAVIGNDKLQITLTSTGTEAGDYNIKGVSANTDYKVTFKGENGEHGIYTIKPAEVTFSLEEGQSYEYTGSKIEPKVNAVWGDSKALDTGEYSIAYGENTNVVGVNKVEITVTGKNFTVKGDVKTTTLEFTITQKDISTATVEVSESYTYTGKSIIPTTDKITVTLKDWEVSITYTVDCTSNTNAGTADISVTGNGNYKGTATGKFTIDPKDITGAQVKVDGEYTYTGTQIQPGKGKISATVDDLTITFDDTITYGNNVTVDEGGTVKITGNGNFTGTATGKFAIKPSTVTFSLTENKYEYTGSQIKPGVSVTWNGGTVLDEGKYSLTYGTNTNVSDDDISVSIEFSDNNFTIAEDSKKLTFTITAKDISTATVEVSESYTYTGSQIQPGKDKISATIGGLPVTFNEEIKYGENINVTDGGTVTITGNGNFTGTAEGSFAIKAKNITGEATIEITTPEDNIIYKNAQWQPDITVTVNGITATLTASDYNVSYGDNKNVGEGKIIITGKGNFNGEAEKTFTIKPKAVTVKVNNKDIAYGESPKAPYELTITGLLSDVSNEDLQGMLDYEIAVPENLGVGNTYTITPKFADGNSLQNYSVTFTAGVYTIVEEGLENIVIVSATVTYDGQAHGLEITGLPGGAEYEFTYKKDGGEGYNSTQKPVNAGVYTVTAVVTLENGATHSPAQATLTIDPKNIDGAQVTVSGEYTYTGTQIQPGKGKISATISDLTVTFDDTITYGNNVTVDDGGTVKITGNGNFTGTAEGKFTIKPATVTFSLTKNEYEYTGTQIKPEVSVTWNGGTVLEEGKYDLTYGKNINVSDDDISVSIELKDTNFTIAEDSKKLTFTIDPKDISTATVEVSESYTYTGTQIQPGKDKISATVDGLPVTFEDTITYGNNVTVDDGGTVTITGNGNFTGTAEDEFKIKPATVTFSLKEQSYEYTGAQIQPEVNVTWNGGTVLESEKYSLTYGDNTNVSDEDISVSIELSDNNFTIDKAAGTLKFTITAKSITDIVTIKVTTPADEIIYKAAQWRLEFTVTASGFESFSSSDYNVSYGDNKNAGEGKIIITGKGNFKDAAEETFTIKQKDLSGATITVTTPANTLIYKNAQWQPEISVTVNGITSALTKENDYTVQYGENKSAGENAGTITVNGNGNFTGTANVTFTILQKELTLNLKPQTSEYNGTEQSVSGDSRWWEATGGVEGDDLEVVLSGSRKNVGDTQITVESVNSNYKLANNPSAIFTITPKSITITVQNQTAEYSNSEPNVDQSLWSDNGGICDGDERNVTLTKIPGVTHGEYNLTGSYSNENYKVTFVNEANEEKPATFTITKKKVTVTVAPKGSVYGDELAELTYTYEGVISGDGFDIKDYIEISTTATQYSDVSGSYTISVKLKGEEAQNYEIDCSSTAAYTLTARPVKYTLDKQSSEYNGEVPQVAQKYTLKEGTVVNNDDLGITVKATELKKDAGTYVLTGDWTNKNYAVEFEAGEYEITKRDISENIMISVNEETNADDRGNIIAQYNGEPLSVHGMASSDIDVDEELEITVTTDVTEIVKMGNYTVKATIEDKNYKGEKVFTVIVSDEKGYTENIYNVLEELEEKTGGINPDELKEEDFEVLKEARKLIDSLTEEEQETAGEELAEYEQLIEAWNNATEADGNVIATAKTIADAPVSALIAASVSAIAVLAYVIGKGGRLI